MRQDILTEKQIELLPLIKEFKSEFYLVGGTAIALYLGHRHSIDFDLFKTGALNQKKITEKIKKFKFQHRLIHQEDDQIHLYVNDVKMTFFSFGYDIPHPVKFSDIVTLPSLLDLTAMKAFALGKSAKWKDYADMYFLLKKHFNFREVSARTKELFAEMFSEKLFKQQLCFFKDIDYTEEVQYLQGFSVKEEEVKNFLTDVATEPF